jgi:2'-5' RNA ligase
MLVYEATGNYYKHTSRYAMMRIFVAIEITNEKVINSITQFQDKIDVDTKPIKSENFHFTLQFLGEVSEEITHEIIKALYKIKFSSFYVNLKGVGTFPKSKSPRIIWIGTDENGGKMLIELSRKVKEALEPFGFFSNKSFKPHITVFRIKKKIIDITDNLKNQKNRDFGLQKVSSIKLKKSELTSNGAMYSDLAEIGAQK